MADTKRQRIVAAIITRLQGINATGAYATNIGARVQDWPKDVQGTDRGHELPLIGVYDTEGQSERTGFSDKQVDRELTIQIRCYVRNSTPGAELRKIIGDIETAIGVDPTWSRLATSTMPSREGADIKSENLEISAAVVEIVVHYTTDVFNPY